MAVFVAKKRIRGFASGIFRSQKSLRAVKACVDGGENNGGTLVLKNGLIVFLSATLRKGHLRGKQGPEYHRASLTRGSWTS